MKSLRPVLWLYALPAILFALVPATHDALLYDRGAILDGQLWRLWTGHWVHFSWSHLGWNLVVLLLAGVWLEGLHPGRLLRYTLFAAPAISGALLLFAPDMIRYGGLSGLASGVAVLFGFLLMRKAPGSRVLGAVILVLLSAKLGADTIRADFLLADFGNQTIRPSLLAHFAGTAAALALLIVAFTRRWLQSRHPLFEKPLASTTPTP